MNPKEIIHFVWQIRQQTTRHKRATDHQESLVVDLEMIEADLIKLEKVLESNQNQLTVVPSDEEIDVRIESSLNEIKRIDENLGSFHLQHEKEKAFMMLGRHQGIIENCKWLKSQIKTMPKELTAENGAKSLLWDVERF